MNRSCYVVANRIERDRREETMPGLDIVMLGENPAGRRWERIIIGRGVQQRYREASPEDRARMRDWCDDLSTRLRAGGELMGALPA